MLEARDRVGGRVEATR
ncbi:hypothetical protein, partial [Mesorhizobium sp.]